MGDDFRQNFVIVCKNPLQTKDVMEQLIDMGYHISDASKYHLDLGPRAIKTSCIHPVVKYNSRAIHPAVVTCTHAPEYYRKQISYEAFKNDTRRRPICVSVDEIADLFCE